MSMCNTRLRVSALLLTALTALLVFAAAASAQVRTGETASTVDFGNIPPTLPEGTLVKASASYDTSGGSVNFSITTGAEPTVETEGTETQMFAELVSDPSGCKNFAQVTGAFTVPTLSFTNKYSNPTSAQGFFLESLTELPLAPPVAKSVSGPTTTLSTTSSRLANQSFNCAVIEVAEPGTGSFMLFPLTALPEPLVPPAPPATPATPAPTAPTPAAAPVPALAGFSIAKPKPLKLKGGKSKVVKIKVSNTGATATAPGILRVKAVKGVLVKPETQQIPLLPPGRSFTLSVRLELTQKAKKKSTLSLVGTTSGVTAKSSLVVQARE